MSSVNQLIKEHLGLNDNIDFSRSSPQIWLQMQGVTPKKLCELLDKMAEQERNAGDSALGRAWEEQGYKLRAFLMVGEHRRVYYDHALRY